jgi:hypothetical protein
VLKRLPTEQSTFSIGRLFTVLLLGMWMLAIVLPSVARLWAPLGTFGYAVDPDGRVTSVSAGLPADRAGLRTGDAFDLKAVPFELRRYAIGPLTRAPVAGTTIAIPVLAKVDDRVVAMTSVAESISGVDKFSIVMRSLGALVFIVVGAGLVLLRPSPMTWGFYLYTIGSNPGSDSVVDAMLPAGAYLINWSLENACIAAGYVGFLVFALRFPRAEVARWRAVVSRLTPLLFVLLICIGIATVVMPFVFGVPSALAFKTFVIMGSLVFAVGFAALLSTYSHVRGLDRQRIKWVIMGFGIALPSFVLAFLFDVSSSITVPYWFIGLLLCLNLLVPVTIAYAVIHHHVIDVSFVISRAVVYTALTALLVATFGIIDFEIGQRLSSTGLTVAIQVVVSIAFAFWLNAIHARINEFVDSTLFKRRHLAEKQLARIARALPHAQTSDGVDRMLVDEPVAALDLTSAALFRTDDSGRAVLAFHRGWPETSPSALDADDSLLLQLTADQMPLDLREVHWHRDDLPVATARPLLALPVTVRRRLAAFVLYSGHRGGEALDPTEQRSIGSLAIGAAAAYDHLEAEFLRRRVAELEAALAQMQQTNQAGRRRID